MYGVTVSELEVDMLTGETLVTLCLLLFNILKLHTINFEPMKLEKKKSLHSICIKLMDMHRHIHTENTFGLL